MPKPKPTQRFFSAGRFLLALLAFPALAFAQADQPYGKAYDPIIDWPSYHDPELIEVPTVKVFNPRLKDLWLEAIDHKNANGKYNDEDRRHACAAIAKAHADGMTGLETTIPTISKMLAVPDMPSTVRLAAAQALIQLDAKSEAGVLLEQNKSEDEDLVLLTDPALAAWGIKDACPVWEKRFEDASVSRIERISAIESLGTIKDRGAAAKLLAMALDKSVDSGIRLACARSASQAREDDKSLQPQAATLLGGDVTDRVVAAALLASAVDPASIQALAKLAQDAEPSVQAIALARLLEVSPLTVQPFEGKLIVSPDSKVRTLGANCIFEQKTPDSIKAVGPLLNDENLSIRRMIRDRLILLDATASLSESVRAVGIGQLESDQWRGQEQAAILLGKVGEKQEIDRLFALLKSERGEVVVASATAIRWLALPQKNDEAFEAIKSMLAQEKAKAVETGAPAATTLPPGMKPGPPAKATGKPGDKKPDPAKPKVDPAKAKVDDAEEARRASRRKSDWMRDHEAATVQLIQLLGLQGYKKADPFFRTVIPKHSIDWYEARSAAVWSLGLFHRDVPDNALAGELAGRIGDINPMDPEGSNVRRFSAITIGRMKAKGGVGALQHFYDEGKGLDTLSLACRWGIQQITGKQIPDAASPEAEQTGWFLEPLKDVGKVMATALRDLDRVW